MAEACKRCGDNGKNRSDDFSEKITGHTLFVSFFLWLVGVMMVDGRWLVVYL
ncbi:hypothetical protein Hanom_Chr06g00550161 [Helianthus anomalus]